MNQNLSRDESYFHASPGFVEWVFQNIPIEKRWNFFCKALVEVQKRIPVRICSFVLMETHCHILFATEIGEENFKIEIFHECFKNQFDLTKGIQIFESPSYVEKIENFQQLLNSYRYIYRNPIEARIVKKAEDYEFSSLSMVLGRQENKINVVDPFYVIQNPFKVLNWINSEENRYYYYSRSNFLG